MSLKVGIIGLGIMGGAFAKNMRTDDISVTGYDLVEENVQALVDIGGEAATSPKDVADKSDIIITSLPSIKAFHDVMTGAKSLKSANKDEL
ncbi:MAG: NAD(P)-binding domain-containing protein, partial [Rhodospirillales bacterium]|nr:NAD(P)-binding domain-containing protein [Rhodospirillales bacterium]